MKPLEQLPTPVDFYCVNPERWTDLFEAQERGELPDPQNLPSRVVHNGESWIVLTYIRLRQRGLDVRLTSEITHDRICVVNGLDLRIKDRLGPDGFLVACRNDGWDPMLADFTIVHNPDQVAGASAFIPTWVQPGLIPRDGVRSDAITTIAFKGDLKNLYEPFRSDRFRDELTRLGVSLTLDGKADDGVHWHDYSESDLVLAVRDIPVYHAEVKPSSKLINAWLAGVPALLGPEPAFQALHESDLDYIEVRRPEDALAAIRRLQENPDQYRAMVDNGLRKGLSYTEDANAERWRETLAGPVEAAYQRWRHSGSLRRRASYLLRAPRFRKAKKNHLRDRSGDPHILTS